MEFNGIKIPTNGKKVTITPNHGDATVKLKKEDVIIIFDEKYFILWKNEFVRVAVKILEQVFEGYFDFKISTNMTGALYARFSLKGGENYEVSCQRYYTFIDIVSQISMPLPMDYFVTAEKAQKTLSNLKLGDEKQYEKIIIYDNNKQQIDDKNFQLKNLSNPKLYFSVGPNQKSSVATTQNINKLTTQYLDSPPVGYQQPGSTQPKAPFVYYPKLDELKSSDNGTKQSSSNSNEENQSPLLRYNTGTKLVIHFICEESVGKKFESFDERIASNMTIGELSNFISNKYGIHGQVKLHYLKDHTEGIEEEKTIKDIIKNLQQKDEKNKINNILYVGRIKSSKSSTKLEPVQPTDVDDDDDVDDDNDNDNENNENKKDHPNKSTKKSKPSIKKMIPKITPVSNDGEKLPESDKGKNKNIIFTFVFNNQEEDMSIPSESLLKNQNKKLHQIFDIESDQKLEFTSQVNGEEEKSIEDENQPMKTFTDKVIHIYIQGELSSPIQLEQLNTEQENNLSVLTKYLARLISGYLFIGEYQEAFHQILGKIGEGATSCTYIVFDKRINKMICKKVIKIKDGKEFKTAQNAVKEFEVMLSLDHPCICKAIGYNTSEKVEEGVTAVAIFMEYLEHN